LTNENIAFKIQINQSDCSADIIYHLIGYSEQLSTNRGKTYIFVLESILQSDIIKAINIQSSSFFFENILHVFQLVWSFSKIWSQKKYHRSY